jgi:hypothetical protein
MVGVCSTHGEVRKYLQLENLKGRSHFRDVGVDGKILKWFIVKNVVMVWTGIPLAQICTSS